MPQKKIKNNMSSSGLTRGSRNGEEQGRSMVEMLGVLAVVGVLSVGGIAGYTYAMNKYYANELLMGASERAVLVAAQLVAGKTPNLNEFANHTVPNGTFGEVKTDIEDGFGITVSGVKDAVCENLIKSTEGTDVSIVNDDEYLTDVTCSGDNNEFLFVFDYGVSGGAGGETDPACADVTCEGGLTCFHGECKCSTGLLKCGTQCCAEGTYCSMGADSSTYTCVKPTSGCTKNSDCKDAEGNVDTTKYCKLTAPQCTGPTGGTCTDKGELDDTNDFTVKTLNLPGGDLTVYKGGNMNWWSASNLCQAHGKQMVTMSDLGIADSGTNTVCFFSKTHVSYATSPCICNGGSDSDCSATNAAIRGAFGTSDYLWLAESATSCFARFVSLGAGGVLVRPGNRHKTDYSALCR